MRIYFPLQAFASLLITATKSNGSDRVDFSSDNFILFDAKFSTEVVDWGKKNKGRTTMIDFEDYDHRLDAIGKRLEKNPDDWEAWAAKADILHSLGMAEIAIRCCDRSLALNPDNVLTWVTKGEALIKLGKFEEAKAAFAKAKALYG